jgi:hypothetical protein
MRVPVAEASTCESWSIALEEQRKALRSEKGDQSESGYVPEALPSPSLLAKNHEMFTQFVSVLTRVLCPPYCVVQNMKASSLSIHRKRPRRASPWSRS